MTLERRVWLHFFSRWMAHCEWPQITIGLLTDASGFPLRVEAFEGNKAEWD